MALRRSDVRRTKEAWAEECSPRRGQAAAAARAEEQQGAQRRDMARQARMVGDFRDGMTAS